ncbi:hypothetical protein BH11GEM2_BH11GEM2_13540 [soil metagenome]
MGQERVSPEMGWALDFDRCCQGNAGTTIRTWQTSVIMADIPPGFRTNRSLCARPSDIRRDRSRLTFPQSASGVAFCRKTLYVCCSPSVTRITRSPATAHTLSPREGSIDAQPVNSPNAGSTPTSAPNQKQGSRSR